jgi:hypothetical protein
MSEWTPEPAQEVEPRTRTSRIFEILLWVMLVGIVASVAIPEIAGYPIPVEGFSSVLIGFLLLPFLIARLRRASHPWLYSLAGAGLLFGLAVLGGVMRGQERRGHENELFAALEQFEPETGKRARAAEKNLPLLKSILQPAIRRAAERAPDAELVAYGDALFKAVETPVGIDYQRCAEITSGAKQTPKGPLEEIRIAKATARLFRAAALHPEPISIDMERSMALRNELMRVTDRDGVLTDPAKAAAMTHVQQCDFYVRTMKNLRELPVSDAALIMRGNMASPVSN